MKAGASGCPCSDSAASCRPAIHPSVRASSVAMSSAARLRPIASLRNPAASGGVNRKSVTRSSHSWPAPRSRASGSCGSSRVAMTRCICGGMYASKNVTAASTGLASMMWWSSMTTTKWSGMVVMSLSSAVRTDSVDGGREVFSSRSANRALPTFGAIVRTAATR